MLIMAVTRHRRHVCARALSPPPPPFSLIVFCFARASLLNPSLVLEGVGVARENILEQK